MTGLELTFIVIDHADRLRRAQGLSVTDLTEAAGITRSYYYYLRARPRVISLDVLARLATALDVTPAELLGGQ